MMLLGTIMHRRLFPVRYRFAYRVFSCLIDVDELPQLHRRLHLFSHNRFNLFSFYDRDHGPRRDLPLRPWVERLLASRNITLEGGRIRLLCFPRVWGYVFNPLSIWYCHHRDGSLRAILCEVSNTFGERHCYLLHDKGRPLASPVRETKEKVFHVSPFIAMDARYNFRITPPSDRLAIRIRQYQQERLLLVATLTGRLVELSNARLLYAALRYPFLTLQVVFLIHWQALRLWLRGLRPYPKPSPPREEVS